MAATPAASAVVRASLKATRLRLAAMAKAKAKTNVQKTRAFGAVFAVVRKCKKNGKVMGSVSDLLKRINTPKANRARPTIGQKMGVWKAKWKWPPNSCATDASCSARGGGGQSGHVATKPALNDIYDFMVS